MNRITYKKTALLLVIAILLLTPTTAFADGGEGGYVVTANGYQVELIFKGPVVIGENEFHIQITDSMGMPVPNAEVEVSAMPSEGMTEHGEDEEMATEVPSTGVMKPNEPAADEHSEEALTIMLEPTMESGEYAGELHFETSGEWMFNVHFTIGGEAIEVDFPIEIARALGLNYAVLAGFFGINGAVIATAAFLKRKPVVVRK
jgi:hypothetical protein